MKRTLLQLTVVMVALFGVFFAAPGRTDAQEACGPSVVVQPGDNLFRIAQRCGVTVDALRSANPQVTDPTRLFVGTVLTIPQAGQSLPPATVAIFPAGGPPGSVVTVVANGLPANTQISVGFGTYQQGIVITSIYSQATSGPYGELQTQTNLPPNVAPGGAPWAVMLEVNGQTVGTSAPFTITAAPGPQPTATPGGTLFDRTNIFMVALNDNGASGPVIGCQDSIIAVERQIAPTVAPMTAAYNELLSLNSQYYGQSGLYNALYQSNLSLQNITIQNRQASVYLTGSVVQGGVCDAPRIQAQLEQVALQYNTVDTVQVFVNGQPLSMALS